ncbi:MAG: hypothetical protein Q9185_001817 [Variospora sp. 1 TL-2023]
MPYEIRAGGDVKNKKQSMADLKLRRLNELNSRLKEDLERPRIKVSEASMSWVPLPTSLSTSTARPRPVKFRSCSKTMLTDPIATTRLIQYCQNTKDFMVPSLWGQVDKREDPYAPQQPQGCCSYAQELLSTFSTSIGEVALVPATGGIFIVDIVHSWAPSTTRSDFEDTPLKTQTTQLWDRKKQGGFPETKQLKKLVRDIIDPGRDLGHVDGSRSQTTEASVASPSQVQPQAPTPSLSITQRAEPMVAGVMSTLPKELNRNGGEDAARDPETPAETSASERAETMVADIMPSFGEGANKKDRVAAIGGGSDGLRTREEGDDGDDYDGLGKGQQGEREDGGDHGGRQGCEDCT